MSSGSTVRVHKITSAAAALAVVVAAGAIGSLVTIPNIPTWYATLAKPSFTPPNWLFGPAWSLLYLLMAVAFWRIMTLPSNAKGKRSAIAIFLVQIVLNALWSVIFFGWHAPLYALLVIGLLLLAILVTVFGFARLDRLAALLLLPYLAWVGFASALNAGVWLLNK